MKIIPWLSAFVLLVGCDTEQAEVEPGPDPLVTVLPEPGDDPSPEDYCKRDGDNLVVEFKNIGGSASERHMDVSVEFATASGPLPVTRTLLPLSSDETDALTFPIPSDCFDPDCSFAISWAEESPVEGVCPG